MAGIAAASHGLKMAKDIREVTKEFDSVELKAKISALQESLGDAKLALIDAKEDRQKLADEVEELKKKLSFKAERTIRRKGMLYERYENGRIALHPFCPKCTDEGKFFTLREQQNRSVLYCPNCSTIYTASSTIFREDELIYKDSAELAAASKAPA